MRRRRPFSAVLAEPADWDSAAWGCKTNEQVRGLFLTCRQPSSCSAAGCNATGKSRIRSCSRSGIGPLSIGDAAGGRLRVNGALFLEPRQEVSGLHEIQQLKKPRSRA